jgi:hypothetical protein
LSASSTLDCMSVQTQIKRTLSKPEAIEHTTQLLKVNEFRTRTKVAKRICEHFGFQDTGGQSELGGCLKALRDLEAKGWFQLPQPQMKKKNPSPRQLLEPVAEPQGVPGEVGQTQGRGRQDCFSRYEETIKDIYVYPLKKDFRTQLGLAAESGLGPLGSADGVDGENWAKQEFGGAPLGDARLKERLVEIAQAKAELGEAFTGVAEGAPGERQSNFAIDKL